MRIATIAAAYLFPLLLFHSTSYAQWQWSNPKPSGYINNAVVFTDAQNGYIINTNGDLLHTADQGNTWHIQQNFPFAHSIAYKDSTLAISAFASVYISEDMGKTWRIDSIPQREKFEIQVISRDTIIIHSVFPNTTHLFLSVDRGHLWQPRNPNFTIKSLWMLNSREGAATSYGSVYKTTDGGLTWNIPDSTSALGGSCIKFRDKDHGFVYAQGQLWRTVDGVHWGASASQVGSVINSIEFVDANTVLAIGDDGIMLRSTDNGLTWPSVVGDGFIYAFSLYSGCFINSNIGFAVGHRGRILKTTNGGLTWKGYAPTYIDITALDVKTGSTAFAATLGDLYNNVYKTTNSGADWTPLHDTLPGTVRVLHFYNKDTGIAMSETPVKVFKTDNGGLNWRTIPLPLLFSNDGIYCAFFIGQNIYLSTNEHPGSNILLSTNAGETWTIQNTAYGGFGSTEPYFSDFFFTDPKTGYGVDGYSVYKTIDSARTWTECEMIPVDILQSIWFTNATTGYAVGDQSYITKTLDSGHTWNRIFIDQTNGNVPGDLKQIRFFDQKIGFVINGNHVYRTINGANSWTLHGTFPYNMTGIDISPDSNLYVYGTYGSILKRSIKTFEIDSLAFNTVTSCSSNISATVSAVFSTVDSVWFEYGTSGYNNTILATPLTVDDTSLKVSGVFTGLLPNTIYTTRVKIWYQGSYYYSDPISFITESKSTPSISLNGATLYSSAPQGNQWYLDGVIIAGATQSSYTPTQSGNYTVISTNGNCASGVSAPFSYILTGINDPVLQRSIIIFPNPVTNTLNIQNNDLKKLQIKIFNTLGVEVSEQFTSKKENTVDMRHLPRGTYLVNITDAKTLTSIQKLVIKL